MSRRADPIWRGSESFQREMKQAVLTGPREFRFNEVAQPVAGPGEVLVKVLMSGACASELEPYQKAENAPLFLGHEVSGEVIGIGAGVSNFKLGDLVTGLFQKGFSDFAVTTENQVLKIPKGVEMAHSFGEPLACAMSAARRTRVELGGRIAVIGMGFMGLLMMQMLAIKGPSHILGIDMRDDALAAGKRLGADEVTKPGDLDAGCKAIFPFEREDDPSRGFDVVVEATGTQGGLTLAGELVKQHGVLSILGYHQGARDVDMMLWNFKAFDVLNAHERRVDYRMDCMARGLALAGNGRLDLASLATHTFALDQVGDAFAALENKPEGFIKSAILFDS